VSRSSLGGREYIFRLNPVAYKYAALTSSDPIFHLFPAPIERTDHRISTDIVEASVRRNCFFVISLSMMHNPCFQAIFGLPLVNSMRRDDVGANRNISNFYQIKCLSLIPVNCSCKYDSPIFSRSASLLDDAKGIHERKTRGSLLDSADSNTGLKDPENDGDSFSETTTDQFRRAFRKTTSRTTPARFGQTTPKTTRAPFWQTRTRTFQGSFRDEPENDPPKSTSEPFLRTPAVVLAGSFRQNDQEGRFRTTPWPVNIRKYHILPYDHMRVGQPSRKG
jgi:hypothetical protein